MSRNITEIQRRLIALGYLNANGDDGKFGHMSLDAYNRFRATIGKGPVVQANMAELNADLFPEEQPAPPPKKPSTLQNWLTGLAIEKALASLKGNPMLATLFAGQKTIITGVVMVLAGALSLIAPIIGLGDVAGFNVLTPGEAWTSLTTGFGLIFLRQGIAKVGQ